METIRCYEKEQLPRGLIVDFLEAVGIDYDLHAWIEQKDQFKGFQRDVMEILFLNKEFCTGENDIRLQVFFEKYLSESYQKQSFDSYRFLSPEERRSILEKYAASNAKIALDFLEREDGRLFYEPLPNPSEKWMKYKGLTVEDMVPIFVRVLYEMDKEYQEKLTQTRRKMSRFRGGRK
jgi:hypothetical protein